MRKVGLTVFVKHINTLDTAGASSISLWKGILCENYVPYIYIHINIILSSIYGLT